MNTLINIFMTFFKIGFVSFGGGYAMIPIIERDVGRNGWLTTQQFTDAIAIAGMSPGPIAANSAIFVGFKTAGVAGAVAAGIGIVLPSLILILFIAAFFFKFQEYQTVKDAFYGLRPVIVGLICYAAINFAIRNKLFSGFQSISGLSLSIVFISIILLTKLKTHPVFIILGSGIMGVMFLR